MYLLPSWTVTAQAHQEVNHSLFLLSLNLLAVLFHTVLEWSDDHYALLCRVLARRQTTEQRQIQKIASQSTRYPGSAS